MQAFMSAVLAATLSATPPSPWFAPDLSSEVSNATSSIPPSAQALLRQQSSVPIEVPSAQPAPEPVLPVEASPAVISPSPQATLMAPRVQPADRPGTLRATFSYLPPFAAQSVTLVGSFNQWDRSATPMTFKDGNWTVTLDLPLGEHAYKFVVNDHEYVTDPGAVLTADDGFGGKNGILRLERPDPSGRLQATGSLEPALVHHRQGMPDRNRLADRTVTLRFATRPGDLKRAALMVETPSGQWQQLPMTRFATTATSDHYRVILAPPTNPMRYVFLLRDSKKSYYFGPQGIDSKLDKRFSWDWLKQEAFEPPAWAKGTVFYQIFPERFANGNRENDPKGTLQWGAVPTLWNFFGGDLQGVRSRLGYLSDLGIEGLYFNPMFEAPSNHKYDTADYTRIDPGFGTFQDFKSLCLEAHRLGMRMMLDGVFNHTGSSFPAFQQAIAKGPNSPSFNWYSISGYPVVKSPKPNYKTWWGFSHLPQLNHSNPDVRSYLLAIAQRWLAPGLADAWRLDVPNEVPRDFWPQFRAAVQKIKPEALIVGEIWGDGSPWLKGDSFDSVMNYRFRSAILDFIAYEKTNANQLSAALDQIRADYGDQVEPLLFNLLDSHDTPRFLHEAGNDKRKLRLAALMQMTFPGMPVIYYGDEVGLTGGADPDNRRTMPWLETEQDQTLLADYRAMIQLRRTHPALKLGDYERLATKAPRVFAFRRTHGTDRQLVILNAGTSPFSLIKLLEKSKVRQIYPSIPLTSLPSMSGVVFQEDVPLEPAGMDMIPPPAIAPVSTPVRKLAPVKKPQVKKLPAKSFYKRERSAPRRPLEGGGDRPEPARWN